MLGQFTRIPTIDDLDEGDAALLVTARLWVALRKRDVDPSAAMTARLGSERGAWQLWLLLEEVGVAWPDPFMVSPPCCRRVSFDETTLLTMLGHARRGERPAFLRLLEEMLPADMCERLYGSAEALIAVLPEPARQD